MAGRLPMGQKELLRGKLMEMVKEKQVTLKEAAVRLRISYRQAKRIYRTYKSGGDAALIHGNYGKPSGRRTDEAVRSKAVELYREKYKDFGPAFAAEKLAEADGITVSAYTLRAWLASGGPWHRKRRHSAFGSRRDRRERFGELIRFDGSPHDRFEGRGPKCCLMNLVDDARGITYARLFEQETGRGGFYVISGLDRALRHTRSGILRP